MKYSYHVPASSYTRASQYTPTHVHTITSHYAPSTKYTPTNYSSSSSYSSAAKYSPTSYTSSYFTPPSVPSLSSSSSYTPYKSTSTYVPSYSKGSRYSSTRHAREPPVLAPIVVPDPEPPKRTVHFSNEIIFQDIVRRGDTEQIGRFMRARKVRVDAAFPSGLAALHEAVLTGNLDVVKLLIRYGADIHQKDEDGWTPLHMACSDGYPDIARYLIRQGASTDAENEGGETPGDLIDPERPECKDLAKLFETYFERRPRRDRELSVKECTE